MQLQRRDLRLLRILLLALACRADKTEALALGLLRRESVTLTMLPDIALIARYAMRAIVHVLAMLPANRAIEVPTAFVVGKLLKIFLELFLFGFPLAFGSALSISRIAVRPVRFSTFSLRLEFG